MKQLVHFTRESNLASILRRGLITRDSLALEGFNDFNDQVRADYTSAVCVSIGFPNYKMWYGIKRDNPGVDWVILVIHPSALWELDCAFCAANAALGAISSIPIGQRKSHQAFRAMYEDVPGKERAKLDIPASWPTNPQAEVLMLQGVPRNYIAGVIVLNNSQGQRIQSLYPELQVWVHAGYFRYRKDYAYWKAGA
ncbi:DarT ssDNA thymidine ADP-ribosyltransferase family protein [Roseateles sp. 22389]|uniref:DarT ssDNA thymidine ADP-ribosyltransferase family protein n=1 Tax=Roseateles sp. 22389 TaxID=3453916 RepID=UPI00262EB8AC|nr:DarT ssDNA thymidine ADP-ribosyltransferase family protein [uncultured Roseateles sp.]